MKGFARQVWLIVRNDIRLLRRTRYGGVFMNVGLNVGLSVLFHFSALAIYVATKAPPSPKAQAVFWWFMAFWMLGASMNAAIGTHYERADFDLLLSSPVSIRAVLLARLASIAATGFLSVVVFVPALVNPAVFLFSSRYLAGYAVWIVGAVGMASLGVSVTLGLVHVLGARRARTVSQVIAALLGASVYLAGQLPNILIHMPGKDRVVRWISWFCERPGFLLPARAGGCEPGPLAILSLAAAVSVGLTLLLLARTLVSGLQDVASQSSAKPKVVRHRWTEGLARAAFRKDLRIIARDPLLLARVLPQGVMAVPIGLSLYRWIGVGALAPACFLLALVLSSALTSVAAAGDECWDLIRMSPTPELRMRRGKIAAGVALPALLAGVAAIGLAVAGRPGLGLLEFVVTVPCCLSAAWMSVAIVHPRPRGELLSGRRGLVSSGNSALQLLMGLYFMVTGCGGLACAASGMAPLLAACLLAAALLGAAAILVFVKLERIVWREETASV